MASAIMAIVTHTRASTIKTAKNIIALFLHSYPNIPIFRFLCGYTIPPLLASLHKERQVFLLEHSCPVVAQFICIIQVVIHYFHSISFYRFNIRSMENVLIQGQHSPHSQTAFGIPVIVLTDDYSCKGFPYHLQSWFSIYRHSTRLSTAQTSHAHARTPP